METVAEKESDFKITTDTPCLALTGSQGVSFVWKTDRVIMALHCINTSDAFPVNIWAHFKKNIPIMSEI